MNDLCLADIYLARKRLLPYIQRTPLAASPWLSQLTGGQVQLKLECLQQTGSFKIRGAGNCLSSLSPLDRQRGVVTASSGNHGRAVAYMAQQLGVKAAICLSEQVPANKVEAIRSLGAEAVISGAAYDDAERHAALMAQQQGLVLVPAFDDPRTIAGQGTIGLELLEENPEVETVIVPLSGGGLLGGIALALKSASRRIRLVGVSMDRAPVMYHSLQAGRPVSLPEEPTLADALAGGINGAENRWTFDLVQRLVDEVVLVSEEQIASAIAFLFHRHRLVVEGGGAVGAAALLSGRVPAASGRTVVVISGGNISSGKLLQIAQQYAREYA
jgi:threonine dehydratase